MLTLQKWFLSFFKGLQPQSVQKDVERTDNVHRLLEGKYLSNHLLFAEDHHGGLPFLLYIFVLSYTEMVTV